MKSCSLACVLSLGLLVGTAPVAASLSDCDTPFTFQPQHGAALKVFVYRPNQAQANAPVLFSLHGVGRKASKMCKDWQAEADRTGQVVVVPWFDAQAYPGQAYNLGGIKGEPSTEAIKHSNFSVIEEVFDEVLRREGLDARSYRIFGHSAGAQVVHRALLTGAIPRASQVFVANAGYYTLPSRSALWPFGLGGLPLEAQSECREFARDVSVLLGEQDNDPNFHSLNRSPGAMAQGPHRLARGETFYSVASQRAKELGCPFNWTLVHVPGVGHQAGKMAEAAAKGLR